MLTVPAAGIAERTAAAKEQAKHEEEAKQYPKKETAANQKAHPLAPSTTQVFDGRDTQVRKLVSRLTDQTAVELVVTFLVGFQTGELFETGL